MQAATAGREGMALSSLQAVRVRVGIAFLLRDPSFSLCRNNIPRRRTKNQAPRTTTAIVQQAVKTRIQGTQQEHR